jgi:hypothetical protein
MIASHDRDLIGARTRQRHRTLSHILKYIKVDLEH